MIVVALFRISIDPSLVQSHNHSLSDSFGKITIKYQLIRLLLALIVGEMIALQTRRFVAKYGSDKTIFPPRGRLRFSLAVACFLSRLIIFQISFTLVE